MIAFVIFKKKKKPASRQFFLSKLDSFLLEIGNCDKKNRVSTRSIVFIVVSTYRSENYSKNMLFASSPQLFNIRQKKKQITILA